ncbi:MAG: hypothetical protein GX957_12540 [Clostridiaceae bacterium]|nr:hypothetical protein [Clostridiaceae bacterium]
MFGVDVTSYLIGTKKMGKFRNTIDLDVGNLKFQYNDGQVFTSKRRKKSIIVMGRFVDAFNPERSPNQILEVLLDSNDVEELIYKNRSLAGRYIIIYQFDGRLIIVPDACATIPVTFTTCGHLYVASNPKNIATLNGWSESRLSKKIKSRATNTHPLPYDMTMYDNIKKMPPNHYFLYNSKVRDVVRYYPVSRKVPVSVKDAAELSSKLLKNIIQAYFNHFKLALPLTAGIDSRLILSLCKDIVREIPSYTFFHNRFTVQTPDIVIPATIAKRFNFEHLIIHHTKVPDDVRKQVYNELGSNLSKLELQNAWTYSHTQLAEYTRLDGNISPLAKSSFGRNLPELLASPSYLVTKTHNYARENRREIRRWVNDIYDYASFSNISKYDLFFWEHRIGNWNANAYMTADLFSKSLNPFNCRYLLETWLRVPRKQRTNGEIHKAIISMNWLELLELPINPDRRFRTVYANPILYYLGVRGKYTLNRYRR